ncbi:MAG: GAF domain-containing protein [candidate division Zixibacteria bacterium]|nr:GAF domain-containing protein [candidate division Zixibacteria bacterium]
MEARKKPSIRRKPNQPVSIEEEVSELTDANKRLKRKIFDLYTIFEISVHLNSMLDSDRLLDGLLLTCIGQMGINGAAIFLAPGDMFKGKKTSKMPNNYYLELARTKGIKFKGQKLTFMPNRRLYHLMQSTKSPLRFDEIAHVLEVKQSEVDKLKQMEAELVIPMILQNQVRGVLTLSEKISKLPFYDNDLEFLSTLVNQLAVAVENSRLYQSEKLAYNQLAATQKQLVESEKMAALGKLSASVAHEINNPLGIIKNYLLILEQDIRDDKKLIENLNIVEDEVNRISQIIHQLLDFYRPQNNAFEDVEISKVVSDTIDVIRAPFKQTDVEIIFQNVPREYIIVGSSEQIRQVLINVFVNAKESMPDGGIIEVALRNINDSVEINISDNGMGIPEKYINKIFEPFFTTRQNSKGTGLGLSVSYGIIQQHGGNIKAENNKNKGASFIISLPLKMTKNRKRK